MAPPTKRDRILEALQDLPADATVDDAIERLVFLAKIDAGLAELDEGKGIRLNSNTSYVRYLPTSLATAA